MMKAQSNWRKRTILFFLSQCITLFGSQVVQMAIVWYVTLQTNSGAWVAAFSVFSYLPQFFVSFIEYIFLLIIRFDLEMPLFEVCELSVSRITP